MSPSMPGTIRSRNSTTVTSAPSLPDRAHLQPDIAATDDHHMLRHLGKRQSTGGSRPAPHPPPRPAEVRTGARGDQDAFGLKRPGAAIVQRHLDGAGGGNGPRPFHPLDLVLLEEEGHAAGQLPHDLVLWASILPRSSETLPTHADIGEMVPGLNELLRRGQQCLGRDAADVGDRCRQASRFSTHATFMPEGCPDRGNIAPGPAPITTRSKVSDMV